MVTKKELTEKFEEILRKYHPNASKKVIEDALRDGISVGERGGYSLYCLGDTIGDGSFSNAIVAEVIIYLEENGEHVRSVSNFLGGHKKGSLYRVLRYNIFTAPK